jgi:hypothetical protein
MDQIDAGNLKAKMLKQLYLAQATPLYCSLFTLSFRLRRILLTRQQKKRLKVSGSGTISKM